MKVYILTRGCTNLIYRSLVDICSILAVYTNIVASGILIGKSHPLSNTEMKTEIN